MGHSEPLVSIGLPVYNGGEFISQALDSLLAQEYENFELIISDNGSDDGTSEVCQSYAAGDRRIRYQRSDENRGALWNFCKVFELSGGKYYMWAAHDDLWSPGYLKNCVAALEGDASLILCCSSVRLIDEAGHTIQVDYDKYDNPDLSSPDVRERVRTLLSRWGWYAFYGLIRADVLRRRWKGREVYGADVLLLMDLCLLGPFAKVPQVLFWYRQFEGKTEEDRAKAVNQDTKPDCTRLVRNLISIVLSSGLRPATKALVIWDILSVVYSSDPAWRLRIGPSRLKSAASLLKPGGGRV